MDAPRPTGAALIGRRVGILSFWLLAVFVVAMSSRSVLRRLYGGTTALAADELHCARALRDLKQDLLRGAAAEVRGDAHDTHAWLAGWDRDEAAVAGRCGALEPTRHALRELRDRIEAMVHEYHRDEAKLSQQIERALSQAGAGAAPKRD